MYRFDPGSVYCHRCGKYVIKPCFFLLETAECERLQKAVEDAKLRSKADDEQE